jgi:hypothetical protein
MISETRNGPRFRVDDRVVFSPQNPRGQQFSERFVVTAVMPRDGSGVFQYRIRPSGAGPQRLVTEPELSR